VNSTSTFSPLLCSSLIEEVLVSLPTTVENTLEHSLVLSPWLYIGDRDAAKDLEFIRKAKIVNIVNCTPERKDGGLNNCF